MNKSSTDEIRRRFDKDVERFSNLETGQSSAVDAQITLELLTESAKRLVPHAETLLDVGCGAGNYTLKMLGKMPNLKCTMIDLSEPMLKRANERVSKQTLKTHIINGDIRTAELGENYYDIILAGAVLHHLRDDCDWERTFAKLFGLLRPGGCLMISDLVAQDMPALTGYVWELYRNYLTEIGGDEYAGKVLDYVEKEDSPRSVNYQLELMKKVGFKNTEILHKNICFAAFGGLK
jgi:tRNA (cmo5U34)-methyltransferase